MTAISTATIAADSHALLVQADLAGKGHASIRNAAILRLRDVYGLDAREIADLIGIRCSTVGNILARHDKKAGTR